MTSGAESYAFENGFEGEKRLRPLAKVKEFGVKEQAGMPMSLEISRARGVLRIAG